MGCGGQGMARDSQAEWDPRSWHGARRGEAVTLGRRQRGCAGAVPGLWGRLTRSWGCGWGVFRA